MSAAAGMSAMDGSACWSAVFDAIERGPNANPAARRPMSEPGLTRLPPAWRSDLAGCDIAPAASGMSGAAVFVVRRAGVDDRYLKIAEPRYAPGLRQEMERTAWHDQH